MVVSYTTIHLYTRAKMSKRTASKFRIRIEDAIQVAGSKARLARRMGLTRGAVNWWINHTESDYLPLTAAVRFLSNPDLTRDYNKLVKDRRKANNEIPAGKIAKKVPFGFG